MSKIFSWHDEDYLSSFVGYPAWQGPQIIIMFVPTVAGHGLVYKIIRNDSTFPEDITDGTEVSTDTALTTQVALMNDQASLDPANWYYYSVFVNDGGWVRVGYIECFTFGSEWAREDLWNHHVPERPFKTLDINSTKRVLSTSYEDVPVSAKVAGNITDNPAEILFDQQALGHQKELRRYVKYLSFEIDKYRDLILSYPKLFNIDTAPIYMLNILSELLKMEFKQDFSPLYKRQLLRFATPRMIRKGATQIIKYFVRMLLENKYVYIEEYSDHLVYWTDVGNALDMLGADNDLVTNSVGSFWFGPNQVGECFDCFVVGSYLPDDSSERIYSPYVYGIYVFYNVEPSVTSKLLETVKWYIKKNICWLTKWFLCIVSPSTVETLNITIDDSNYDDLNYVVLNWNDPAGGQGWNDPFNFLPEI